MIFSVAETPQRSAPAARALRTVSRSRMPPDPLIRTADETLICIVNRSGEIYAMPQDDPDVLAVFDVMGGKVLLSDGFDISRLEIIPDGYVLAVAKTVVR